MPIQNSVLTAIKYRFHNGDLEIFVTQGDLNHKFAFWFNPRLHPNTCSSIARFLDIEQSIIHGNPINIGKHFFTMVKKITN